MSDATISFGLGLHQEYWTQVDATTLEASPNHPRPIQNSSAFAYAHSFSIHNPLMAEHVYINDQRPSPDHLALSWLLAHTMRGVEFCSAVRDPPPRCHPGTRKTVFATVQGWLDNPQSKQRLLWLYGSAGVGKSAIAQSLAEDVINCKQLSGATLFLDQSPALPAGSYSTHNEPSRLWTTISYRLATSQSSYLPRVQREIRRDPKLVEQSMAQQFHSLITEPIGRERLLNLSPNFIPIFIDGLDQYQDPEVQERVVQLILDFIQTYPDSPLVWIITSRPERHLVQILYRYQHLREFIETLTLPIDSEDVHKDVQLFLRDRFSHIRWKYDIVEPIPWPDEKDLVCLFVAASGLFIFAYAIICFIEDRDTANPVGQFDTVLSMISPSSPDCLYHPPELEDDPLHSVHAMYTRILRNVPRKHYHATRRILGFLLLPNGFGRWTRDSTTFWALCNILNINQHEAYACLSKFSSVLDIPGREDATRLPVRFLHNSFANYLTNKHISGEFWIDMKEVVADLWHCHWRALKEANTISEPFPKPSNIRLAWSSAPLNKIEKFRNDFWENARRVFFHHLLPCPSRLCPIGPHYDGLSDTRNPSKLIEIFQEIDFDKLVDGYAFPDVPYRFIAFLDWVVQEENPLRKEGLVQSLEILNQEYHWIRSHVPAFKIHVARSKDGGYTTIFKAYTNQKYPFPVKIEPSRLFSTREQSEPFSLLLNDLKSHEGVFSSAITMDKGRCAILINTSIDGHKFYYVLPRISAAQQLSDG